MFQVFHKLDDDTAHSIEVAWCPSHCNIPGNDRADELAKKGTQLAWPAHSLRAPRGRLPSAEPGPPHSHWHGFGKGRRHPVRGYPIANRISPSLNPTKHFTELQNQREVFGRLVQCRTGHTYTGEFRKQFLPEKSVDCECGEALQTRELIIRTCNRYKGQRTKLQKKYRELALPELLETPKGIVALSEFIRDSGAFTFTGEKYTPKDLPTFFEEPEPPDIDSEEDDSDAEQ